MLRNRYLAYERDTSNHELTGSPMVAKGRFSKAQVEILKLEFEKRQEWDLQQTKNLATRLNLRHIQVYKWHWDMKKKIQKREVLRQKLKNGMVHKKVSKVSKQANDKKLIKEAEKYNTANDLP